MDSVTLRLSADDVGGHDLLSIVPKYLTDISEHLFTSGHVISGKQGNLKVTVSRDSLKIQNSLTKYYLGNNLQMIGRKGIQQAIEQLSDAIHLPIGRATVKAFHFARNITLVHPVGLYLPYLGNSGRYERLPYRGGITYKVTGREFAFYDKVAELKAARESIPKLYTGANVLRIEDRHLQRVAAYFKMPEIRACTLHDETFYQTTFKDWLKQYLQVEKLQDFRIDMSTITTKREMQSLGVLALINLQGGELAALQYVNERFKTGQLSKKQAHDLREEIRRCCKLEIQTLPNILVTELNKKVRESTMYWR